MIEKLSTLPLYQEINVSLLLGAMLLCLLVWLVGATASFFRHSNLPRIPRFEGSIFPHPLEEGYTLLFIVFFTSLSLMNITTDQPENGTISPADAWFSAIATAIIYTPMALRYLALPFTKETLRWKNVAITLATLGCIYLFSIAIAASGLLEWLRNATGSPEQQQVTEQLASAEALLTLAALLFSAIIIAPIMEEFAFRGFIYNVLRQRAGIFAAALSSSLLFSAVHTSLVQAPVLFIFGCAQCYLYEKTRSIIYPMLLHAIFNSVSTLALFLLPE